MVSMNCFWVKIEEKFKNKSVPGVGPSGPRFGERGCGRLPAGAARCTVRGRAGAGQVDVDERRWVIGRKKDGRTRHVAGDGV